MNKLKIYCTTSDNYHHALKVFCYTFNKFWGNDWEVVVLGYKTPEFDLPTNFSFVSMGVQTGPDDWSNDLKKYFESINFIKRIDGLINNVGIAGPTKYLDKVTNTEWENTISTNLNSHFYFSKYSIPLLKKNKSGSIINISSSAGLYGFPQRTPYAASKWAIIGLTKSMAMELGEHNIRVNAVCPGSVEGKRMNRVIEAKANLLKSKPSIIKKEFESMVSMRSFVSKDEITSIIIYLLSDFSKNISGQSISVDGNTERMI